MKDVLIKYNIYNFACTTYIVKLISDMYSYVLFVLREFWMSTFSHDAQGKYCICKAVVSSAQYCKTRELDS